MEIRYQVEVDEADVLPRPRLPALSPSLPGQRCDRERLEAHVVHRRAGQVLAQGLVEGVLGKDEQTLVVAPAEGDGGGGQVVREGGEEGLDDAFLVTCLRNWEEKTFDVEKPGKRAE